MMIILSVMLHASVTLGQELGSDTIFFANDSYSVENSELDKIKAIPFTKIRLEGRADNSGRHDYNLGLSKQRINSVMQLLLDKGHQLDHISYDYLGDAKPIGKSSAISWKQKKRCVIIFYELEKDSIVTTSQALYEGVGKQKKYSFINKQGISFTLDNGVEVSIPANTFRALSTDTIAFSITSYMTKSDFILAGLHSMAGENVLESAGMFFLEATTNGKTIDKTLQKPITIEVPNKTNKDDFELFYGQESSPHDAIRNIDWVQTGFDMPSQISPLEESEAMLFSIQKNPVLNTITMRTTQLDWINCDRFYRVKKTEPLFVDTDKDASVCLVFSKFNGIVRGWYKGKQGFSFGKIPTNEPYTILAYKSVGEDVLFAEGSSSSPSTLVYKKITKEEFKTLIAKY